MTIQRILLAIIPGYALIADSVYCDQVPIKKADIGSNFLERE